MLICRSSANTEKSVLPAAGSVKVSPAGRPFPVFKTNIGKIGDLKRAIGFASGVHGVCA